MNRLSDRLRAAQSGLLFRVAYLLILYVSLLFALPSIAAAETVIIEGLTDVREKVTGSHREIYYDIVQYRASSVAGYTFVQNVVGLYLGNNGGTYGSPEDRQVYAAQIEWLNWANGKWFIRQSSRPQWLTIGSSKFLPRNRMSEGELYYEVITSGNGGGDGGVAQRLFDGKLLRSVVNSVIVSRLGLHQFSWGTLRRLTGNTIRMLFEEMGRQASAMAENPELAGLFSDLGEEMANLQEQQLALAAKPIASVRREIAAELRGRASSARERSQRIGEIYGRMFNAATSAGMRKQLNGFQGDFERTLRRVEGNWTLQVPRWEYLGGFDMTVFSDLRGADGQRLHFDDTKFPVVRVFPVYPITAIILGKASGEQFIYFAREGEFDYVPDGSDLDQQRFPEIIENAGWLPGVLGTVDGGAPIPGLPAGAPRQVFRIASTGKWYVMCAVRTSTGARVLRYWEIGSFGPKVVNPVENPFVWPTE